MIWSALRYAVALYRVCSLRTVFSLTLPAINAAVFGDAVPGGHALRL